MTIGQYNAEVNRMRRIHGSYSLQISPDFQCNYTEGFPTSMGVCWEAEKAWLTLNESIPVGEAEAQHLWQLCADYGFKTCRNFNDFNRLLEGLGEDALRSAELIEDEEEIEMGGM